VRYLNRKNGNGSFKAMQFLQHNKYIIETDVIWSSKNQYI